MLSKKETEYYYNHWINYILKFYINNYGNYFWENASNLFSLETENRIPWENKIHDKFIINSRLNKSLIGLDILNRGMYFPFFTINNMVVLGYHRLYSLKLINSDKNFLCIELNKNHIQNNIKYENNKLLENTIYLEIPLDFIPPPDSRTEFDYLVLKNRYIIKNNFKIIEVKTYRDLIDVLRIVPHWIRNELFEYKIDTNIFINSKKDFEKWLKE